MASQTCVAYKMTHGNYKTLVEVVVQDLMDRDEPLKQLKFHVQKAQNQMAHQANVRRKMSQIQLGDQVYLKIRPHRQTFMPTKLHPKLSARYYGPYLVLQQKSLKFWCIGKANFRKKLPRMFLSSEISFPISTLRTRLFRNEEILLELSPSNNLKQERVCRKRKGSKSCNNHLEGQESQLVLLFGESQLVMLFGEL